ncbi:hypothetical protein CRENPOLYSF2_2180001 [Crenothrix polyspora]|uniref:DUF4114 domain-containing protein n=1 Tax=Crenothrix polyspora TaxID=360316 RepID=A0A1R4H4Y4_9GAMM|nr:hypothetical protein CRENPOLYSF2_2180001 [Crenothrix polyspora]
MVDTIIFPNFSDNVLQFGKTVDLGNFVAGDAIGFTIVANGWVPYVAATRGVSASGGIVDPNKAVSKIFRTIKRFNPEPADTNNLQAHTILFAYPEEELMVLAFEDLNRQSGSLNDYGYTSDNDFNDVVIAIHVTPFSAVDCTNCNLLVQSPSCKTPITTVPIPDAALTNNGRKVNICHFTSSATNPWNFINISANALDTHLNHHDDVFQVNGACPPVSAGICPTTPTCTAPQILDSATNTCVTTAPTTPTCTAPQVLDSATNTCVTPAPTTPTCTAPQVLDSATNTCITPPPGTPDCTAPQVLDSATNTCVTPPPPTCTEPQVLDTATNTCVTPEPPTCTAPQVLDATTNTCKSPAPLPPVIGDSGPISWREITVPKEVDDPNRTAKAAAKAAKIKAANGNGNSTDTGNSTTTTP